MILSSGAKALRSRRSRAPLILLGVYPIILVNLRYLVRGDVGQDSSKRMLGPRACHPLSDERQPPTPPDHTSQLQLIGVHDRDPPVRTLMPPKKRPRSDDAKRGLNGSKCIRRTSVAKGLDRGTGRSSASCPTAPTAPGSGRAVSRTASWRPQSAPEWSCRRGQA